MLIRIDHVCWFEEFGWCGKDEIRETTKRRGEEHIRYGYAHPVSPELITWMRNGRKGGMPIHKVKGGWQWGERGKVYPTREGAEKQAQAAYAAGWHNGEKREKPAKGKKGK